MRILFDQGVKGMRNKGNVALLQVAVARLNQMWPAASLEVLTDAPHLLRLYCPTARPVSPDDQYDWTENGALRDLIIRRMPRPILRLLFELREEIWRRWPVLGKGLTRMTLKPLPQGEVKHHNQEADLGREKDRENLEDMNTALETVEGADLFVATGAQYMSDACRDDALRVLDRLEAATQLGIPTAMLGQGLGPFEDQELRARIKAVFPLVNLIFIRDSRVAPPLLNSLGVDLARVIFTGDDAIELAYEARTTMQGSAIGVSLRIAPYTQVGLNHIEMVRPVLHQAAGKYRTKLIAIPISHSAHELDDRVIEQVLTGQNDAVYSRWKFDTPLELINKVGRCRLVVTGAFHPAVFALAQGIPAVGLAKSGMYIDKFMSLADQFGPGCQVVHLDDEHFQQKVTLAIDTAWESAEEIKPQLLEAAARHVELGRAAYQQIFELVESKDGEKALPRGKTYGQP